MLNFCAQPNNIDIRLIPKVGMTFSNMDEACNFYSQYAYEVGFPLKKYRERKNCKWLNCSMEGKNAERVAGNPRIRNTCSKRDRKSTRLNSSHITRSRMPSSA